MGVDEMFYVAHSAIRGLMDKVNAGDESKITPLLILRDVINEFLVAQQGLSEEKTD